MIFQANLQLLLSGNNVPNISPSQTQLTRLFELYQNERYDEAERLATSITQQFPEHPFSWKVLGALLKQTNRISESLVPSQKAVEISPGDAEAHNNLGTTMKQLGRLEEAEASYRQAIALKAEFAEAHNNLGNTLKQLSRLEEAEASYRQAINLKPDFAEAYFNIGVVLQDLGKLEEAELSLRQAIAFNSDYAEAHINLGTALQELGRLEEAEASYRQAIALKANYAEAYNNLGIMLQELGRLEEAAEPLMLSGTDISKAYLLRCFYKLNQQSNFYEQLDHIINQGENNALIGSLISQSNIRYGIKKYNPFCNEPLKYVYETNLLEQCDFKTIFIQGATQILGNQKVQHRSQGLLKNGVQTAGNVFDQSGPVKDAIQKIIYSELEKYRVHFKDSTEGLITDWPTNHGLNGWLVSMKSGGELNPHIHERGWISGSIYINIPPKLNKDSGNLVVGLGDLKNGLEGDDNTRSIDVVTGSFCLFPSSLHHYTIPFKSKEDRIVLAFDVVPRN